MKRTLMFLSLFCAALFLTVPAYAEEGDGTGKRAGKCKHKMARLFKRFDKNADGTLSSTEVPERLWKRISKADADGDGAVSKAELKAARKGRKGGKGRRGRKGKQSDK